MANNSAKKNEQSMRTTAVVLMWVTYGLLGWFMVTNSYFLIAEQVSIWHWLLCGAVAASSYFCYKQIIKCWELQLPPEAAEYYYDLLALNSIVQLIDPFTHAVWHLYWLIVVYLSWLGLRWLWDYITPKYDEPEEESTGDGKKREKKERQKVKYMKH